MPKIVQFHIAPGGNVVELADNNTTALDVESVAGEEFIIADTATPKLILKAGGSASQDVEIDGNGNLSGSSGQYSLRATAATATGPNFCPDNGDLDTGIGSSGNDQLSLITGGVEGIRIAKDDSLDVVYVGINGAADDVNNTLLQLNGDSDEAELAFKLSGGETTTMGYRGQAIFSIDANGGIQFRNQGGSKRAEVDTSGNFTTFHTTTVSGADLLTTGAVATALTDNGGTASVSTSGSSTTLTGVNTAFTTDFHVGAAIKVGTVTTTVTAIASDTSLTLEDAIDTGSTGTTCTRDSGELFAVKTGDSQTILAVNGSGAMTLGTKPGTEDSNIAIGDGDALDTITEGKSNIIIGHASDNFKLTTGKRNIFMGYRAGEDVVTNDNNVMIGFECAQAATNHSNTFIGAESAKNATGFESVAIGKGSMMNCTGDRNAVVGVQALDASGDADNCVAVGFQALTAATNNSNIGIGYRAGNTITTGYSNVLIGSDADGVADKINQIAIGQDAVTDDSNKVRLGNTSITNIDGEVAFNATSDARTKTNVEDLALGLSFINALRPVSFTRVHPAEYPAEILDKRYKQGRKVEDENGNVSFESTESFDVETGQPIKDAFDETTRSDGLIAQEVQAVCDSLGVQFNGINETSQGKLGLQYGLLVAPLIKAVQELTARIEQLEGGD